MYRLLLFLPIMFSACIPLKTAPKITDYRITSGKDFEKGLSDRTMFVFHDPKDAGEFYDFVNTKFKLNNENVYDDVPFIIDESQYFFAFYEIERVNKTLNLFPVLLTMALDPEDGEYFSGDEISRKGNWYLAIEVYSDNENDCLSINSLSRAPVLEYLRSLKKEYLSTDNYNELVLEN